MPQTTSATNVAQLNKTGELAQEALFFLIGGPLLVISMILAIHNLKVGATDKTGALKFAVVMLIVDIVLGLFEAHHNASPGLEMTTFLSCLINALGRTVRFWIYYLALEPFVRKTWPKVLVSWNRLLQGKITDPFVSQEILFGCIFGALGACLVGLSVFFSDASVQTVMDRKFLVPETLVGGQGVMAGIFGILNISLSGVFNVLIIIVFRLITRYDALAVLSFVGYFTYIGSEPSDGIWSLMLIALFELLTALVILRFGLLALIVFYLVADFLTQFPLTLSVNDWFFPIGLIGLGIPVALAVSSFFFTMGDKSPLKSRIDHDV